LDLLLLVKFVYNNVLSITASISLFFANKSYYLSITIYLERDIISSYAHKFTIDLRELQNALKTEIFAIQQCYQQSADINKALA